ncbi:HK97-gp10 family putative phage morphogenesis protein [Bacillus haynesii]|uniref:HK97-gp10 family putative phage morphogenesis protein n=1 Tax=Bacillus haynesii TaxID=1925021 RepID=UPI0022827356|nr:HK97-gp10 family putative phage morphogenesis protein [Bacillus haynesii]MCY7912275.1 HK97 gp10 family phage protein [Bacillus haynesii]MCY7928083.1 HK97 gp10 family phage protein [Bacillus haynesii]MCY8013692.1 HK97 gp10 family phage protein [Bacillus haynesii]MCY8294778.1 HK97 gp10 family phage protein [Bacillus haynesii]MCY8772402.1 HK97 gp10 family phage protein [Bacillus haynesii]
MAEMNFEGLADLDRYFERIGEDVEQAEDVALQAGGEIIAEHQRQNVNRSDKNQPHIADNITVSKARESKGAEKFVSIGPNKKVAYRARFLEYGTSKMPPYPFIEKGRDEGEASAVEVMARILTAPIK